MKLLIAMKQTPGSMHNSMPDGRGGIMYPTTIVGTDISVFVIDVVAAFEIEVGK